MIGQLDIKSHVRGRDIDSLSDAFFASHEDAFFSVNTPRATPSPNNTEKVLGGEMTWGENNLYPLELLALLDSCSTFQSIIERTSDYIAGDGITDINPQIFDFAHCVNDEREDLFDLVDLVGWNSEMFGGAFILVTRTADKKDVGTIRVLDAWRCRCLADGSGIKYHTMKDGKLRKDGEDYLYFTGWDEINDGTEFEGVYFWRGRRPRGFYPRPRYTSALQAIDTQVRIQEYYSSLVKNNFTLGGILTIPSDGLTDDDRKTFKKKLDNTYKGEGNAGRLMVQFVSSSTLEAKYTSISANDLDKQYVEVAKSTRENIYAGFCAIPALFGIMTETTGFNEQEFLSAFTLYNTTVVAPRQRDIERVFSDIFGVEKPFLIKPFNFQQNAK